MISRRLLRIKVIKALYSHYKSENESLIFSQKELNKGIEATFSLYVQMLRLVVDVADYAQKVIDINRSKMLPTDHDKNPNLKFVDNIVINQIRNSDKINSYLKKSQLSWNNYPELIKKLYNNMVSKDYYLNYLNNDDASYQDDKRFVIDFYYNEIEDFEDLHVILEEMCIYWIDDVEFVASHIIKTVKQFEENMVLNENNYIELPLSTVYKNSDDEEFVKELFFSSIRNKAKIDALIQEVIKNWEMERIVFMDRLIMQVALSEVMTFPTIPTNVSLDEYIELAKYYSTPGSSNFINGILDNISTKLIQSGEVKKSI